MHHLLRGAAGLLVVSVREGTRDARVQAGRTLFSAWLELTAHGWAGQPVYELGAPFTALPQAPSLPPGTPARFADLYRRGRPLLAAELGLPSGSWPAWVLRVGRAPATPLPRRTLRLAPPPDAIGAW